MTVSLLVSFLLGLLLIATIGGVLLFLSWLIDTLGEELVAIFGLLTISLILSTALIHACRGGFDKPPAEEVKQK